MPFSRTLWCLLSILVGINFAFSSGKVSEEGGCDRSLTQPCRSNSSLCVPHEHVSDGIIDCPDGSDEDCEEWQHECLCGFPRCIDKAKVGDGTLDCIEGSDELAIEKEAYICPTNMQTEQELLRKKRRAFQNQAGRENSRGGITNYYSISSGPSPSIGVLTSTVYSFVNEGTTSEYLTHVRGTSINGGYAQVTSLSSRTFFALPTRLRENQVDGLVSSFMRTTVSNGYTKTIVSRIYHTNIDGTYAQLVETETKGVASTSVNYVTILQGEELHGTFLSHPDNSLATLKFSHLEGSLNPAPVAAEVVTVTGTYGKFIRDGTNTQTTYSVFTGSYMRDNKEYIFFFGNSALPNQKNIQTDQPEKLKMKQHGHEKRTVIVDMEKDMEVIMPSELKMLNMASKNDFLIGEGMIDGHKLDGVFIADSEGFDVKGAHKKGGGDIKLMTVTIGQPSIMIMNTQNVATEAVHTNISLFDIDKQIESEADNEVDSSLLQGRKANINGNEIIIDTENIMPTRPLPVDIPTFVIEEPNQNIGDILLREKIKMSISPSTSSVVEDDNVVENIKAKFNQFNIGDFGLGESDLPTVTYYGFAEFTTTIADTVVVFSPNSLQHVELDTQTLTVPNLQARVISTEPILPSTTKTKIFSNKNEFSNVTTQVFNTVDLYPSGLVSSIGGTVVNDDMTTKFTTLVYGTYIQGQYAQVVRSTSSIFYLVSRSETPTATSTKSQEIITKTKFDMDDNNELGSVSDEKIKAKEGLFDSLFNNFQSDNAIGRSVDGISNDQNVNNIADIKEDKDIIQPSLPIDIDHFSVTTFTVYTTQVKDGKTVVSTNYKTTTISSPFEVITKSVETSSSLSTFTHHTTQLIQGTTNVQSSLEVVSTSSVPPMPPSNSFFNILASDTDFDSGIIGEKTMTEEMNESVSETGTESSVQDTTDATGFSLESSLNPENAVNAIYFPRTYYTTYTYFTTYHRLNSSSVVSSLETITNVVSDLQEHKTLTPAIPTYPVTYWTTYTYWATLVKDNSSITTSSKKTVSNIVSITAKDTTTLINEEILPIEPTAVADEQPSTQDVTKYFTTYTYYTTAIMGDSTVVETRLETESSVVTGEFSLNTMTTKLSNEPFGLLFDFSTTQTFDKERQTETVVNPFGTIFDLAPTETSIANTNLETEIPFDSIFGVETPHFVDSASNKHTFDKPIEILVDHTPPEIAIQKSKTGLLSTIRQSVVIDGLTTMLSTSIYGTYVNGVYMETESTTSEILTKTVVKPVVKQTGVLTVDAGSIIENGITTHYTIQHVGKYIDGEYMEDILSHSNVVMMTEKSVTGNDPTKTGRVKEIIGSIIHGTKTTYYHSTVSGTVIGGIYAQKVESTSRFVSGPSITFNILGESPSTTEKSTINENVPVLEPSIETVINPTPVIVATESLELENTRTEEEEKSNDNLNVSKKNRLSFPIRTSKRRTDSFPFIRRTSTFRKQDALSKVLAAPTTAEEKKPSVSKPKPEKVLPEPETKTTRSFRFGSPNSSPPRTFRFIEKIPNKINKIEKPEKKTAPEIKTPAPKETKIVNNTTEDKHKENNNNFRPFRFRDKSSTIGTRSSLPVHRRERPASSDKPKLQSNRFRFGTLPEQITEKSKLESTTLATTTAAAPKSKRPNPFAFIARSTSDKIKQRPKKPEVQRSTVQRKPIVAPEHSGKRPQQPRTRLGGLFPRRRPIIPRLNKEGTNLDPVYLLPDGTMPTFNNENVEFISFNSEDAIESGFSSRKKRQVKNFRPRMSSRGIRRLPRNKQSDAQKDAISPSPSEPARVKQPFTISNPRTSRTRLRAREGPPKPQKATNSRTTIPRPSKSRNTLPFRPRRTHSRPTTLKATAQSPPVSPRRGFRRPSTNNRFKISNRFSPKTDSTKKETPISRRPSKFSGHQQRQRTPSREPPPSRVNPIQSFLERPKPPPTHKPDILEAEDGTFTIVEALTVTREVPVTTTIPLIENGQTVEKKVITASLVTETFLPEQITQTEISGQLKLLLSTVESKQKVTQVFIQPITTTTVTFVQEFVNGVRTSSAHTMPHTLYSIVTATALKTENDVGDLLKLLLLQQQHQNPFLAALGLNRGAASTEVETRTFVTTITSFASTEIPIIFRGKPIRTTVVETNIEVITTSEVTTKTISPNAAAANPLSNPSPFGGLLPLLLQNQLNRKAREIRPTKIEDHERTKRSVHMDDMNNFNDYYSKLDKNEIVILPALYNIEELEYNMPTPPLNFLDINNDEASQDSFLWSGPAESTPLSRKVRNTERGNRIRQRVRIRNAGARKITSSSDDEQHFNGDIINNQAISKVLNVNRIPGPTTYYTTFTYYTTYLDNLDREVVKSSEETITQVATYGIRFDDFAKTNPTSVRTPHETSIYIQEKFTPKDAIIPGKPRPVPDPVFKDPEPPHGPVIRHDDVNLPNLNNLNSRRRKTVVTLRKPHRLAGGVRRQKTKIRLSSPISVVPRDSIPAESKNENIEGIAIENELELKNTINKNVGERRRIRITVTKKRLIKLSASAVVDKSVIEPEGKKRIVITRRLPQPHATAVASSIDPFMGSVSTFYTVYSYLYSIFDGTVPISFSTKVETISNSVQPTHVNVPAVYQTLSLTSNLYTIEEGQEVATLSDRVSNGYTTKTFLTSATLVHIPQKTLHRPTIDLDNIENPNFEDEISHSEINKEEMHVVDLQSSLQDITSTSTLTTPKFSKSPTRTLRGPLIKPHTRGLHIRTRISQEIVETTAASTKSHLNEETKSRSRGTFRFGERRPSISTERRNKFHLRNKRPHNTVISPNVSPFTEKYIHETSFAKEEDELNIFSNVFDDISGTAEDTYSSSHLSRGTSPSPSPSPLPSSSLFSSLTSSSPYVTSSSPFTTSPPSSPAPPTRPPRPAVRRDDIPIIRRPESERKSRPSSSLHKLKFTSTTESGDESLVLPVTDVKIDYHDYDISVTAPDTEPVVESPIESFSLFDTFKSVSESDYNVLNTDEPPITDSKFETPVKHDTLNFQSSLLTNKSFENNNRDYYENEDYYYDENIHEDPVNNVTLSTSSVETKKDSMLEFSTGDATPKTVFNVFNFLGGSKVDKKEPSPKGVFTDTFVTAKPSLHEDVGPNPVNNVTLSTSSVETKKDSTLEFSTGDGTPKTVFNVFNFLGGSKVDKKEPSPKRVFTDTFVTDKPSFHEDLGPNVVYSTYTTFTYLPILGGEQSITLTLLTSRLVTLTDVDLSPTKVMNDNFKTLHTTPTIALPTSPKPLDASLVGTLSDSDDIWGPLSFEDTPSISSVSLTETAKEGGRAVFGHETFDQAIPSDGPVEAQLGLNGRHNLATKVMENGVQVIVAGEKPSGPDSFFGDFFLQPTSPTLPRPTTLPPSTLSNQMLLFSSTERQLEDSDQATLSPADDSHYNTYFTTLTYYNTILQDDEPIVRTSKETLSNVISAPLYVSGNFVEQTQINLVTSTYVATQTFTKTIGDLFNPQVVTSEEIITQVVVTEAPSISRSRVEIVPTYSTMVTKTYLTTFTYYKTYSDGIVETETVVSSDITTETVVSPVSPLLPVVSITTMPNSFYDETPYQIFATKTYFTTSTYLTTILKRGQTITSSHTEVTSNIITEPITSVYNTDDIINSGSTLYQDQFENGKFEEVGYVSINGDVYKQYRTLFATYTHYTTLHNGRVKSSEVTKTQVLTSTITTTSVPVSLLLDLPIIQSTATTPEPAATTKLFDSFINNMNVELDPSFLESSTTKYQSVSLNSLDDFSMSNFEKSSTLLVKDKVKSDVFAIEDSIAKATMLVRPTEELSSDFASQDIKSTESSTLVQASTSSLFEFDDMLSESIEPTFTSSVLEFSTTLLGIDGEYTTLHSGDNVIIATQIDGEVMYFPDPEQPSSTIIQATSTQHASDASDTSTSLPTRSSNEESTSPVRADHKVTKTSDTTSNEPEVLDIKSETVDKDPNSEGSGFSFAIPPMLTAVAGLIGNTFVGKLAGNTDVSRSKVGTPMLPKNIIIAAEKEPLLIPVGGVGASLSSSQESTIKPEHGFIPLRRPDPEASFTSVFSNEPFIEISNVNPDEIFTHSPASMEKFGPSFRPPVITESGFTAMTTGINPTKVSVISGEETIFFGGFDVLNLPPPGQPAPKTNENSNNFNTFEEINPISVHIVESENQDTASHLISSNNEYQNIPFDGNIDSEYIPGEPKDFDNYYTDDETLIDTSPGYIDGVYIDPDFIEPTAEIDNLPRQVDFFASEFPLTTGEENHRTTVIQGSSTVMSGATTIFDTLFTRPADLGDQFNVDSSIDDTEKSSLKTHVIHNTKTRYEFIDGFPIPVTEVINITQKLRTLVPTIVDTAAQLSNNKNDMSSNLGISKTKLKTVTVSSSTIVLTDRDDSNLFRNTEDYPGMILKNDANLGYEEENEISRFIESQSPDQDVREPHKTSLCTLKCSSTEMCKVFNQEQTCICKPGYSRRIPTDLCKKSNSFQLDIALENLNAKNLSYSEQLLNKAHPNTQSLIKEIEAGIENAMINSKLGRKYQSISILEFDENSQEQSESNLVARVKIDVETEMSGDTTYLSSSFLTFGSETEETTDEKTVQSALESSLKDSNYSLGGGEVFTHKGASVLAATDFDECHMDEHNDCHPDADCINVPGTFTCECQPGFRDIFDYGTEPGRHCVESNTCTYCNYHGKCDGNAGEEITCICNDWFSGEHCEINMKVMLIVVVSVGAFLLLLFVIFVVFCCCRTRDQNSQGGFLRSSGHGEPSTLDRRAMIHDSASEISEDLNKLHHTGGLHDNGKLPPMPITPQADYSIGKRSGINLNKDPAGHTAMPPVLIPRIKGYNSTTSTNRGYTQEREKEDTKSGLQSEAREAALIDILDGVPPRSNLYHQDIDAEERGTVPSVHSFVGKGNHGEGQRRKYLQEEEEHHRRSGRHHRNHFVNGDRSHADDDVAIVGDPSPRSRSNSRSRQHHDGLASYRTNSIEALDASTQDLSSQFGANSLRYGNRTVSQARSFDETTVRAPIRTLREESFRSREISSQVMSDGLPTNAERDGNSTIVYPQMQLYKPLREADSMSDLTGHQKLNF